MVERNKTYDLGVYGELGKLVAKGDLKAFALVLKGAKEGNGDAQLEAGFAYAQGFCVKKNNRIAAEWYEKAASQGVLNAQFNLGCLHYLGLDCKRSVQNALRWFELAAKGGHARAKQNLVSMTMEAELAAEEHAYWIAIGVNKAMGVVKYDLAHSYLTELKKLVVDPEVRRELSNVASDGRYGLAKASEIQQALTLVYNISSATPLAIEKVLYCAVNNDWQMFDTMPAQ